MKPVVVLGMLVGLAGPAAGQTPLPPDSAARVMQDLLIQLRHAVDQVSGRVSDFRRDLRTVGDETVLARAARLEAACHETRAALAAARPTIAAARLTAHQTAARDSLLIAMSQLSTSLTTECERGLGPAGPGNRADTLRAWGPSRTAALTQVVGGYHGAAGRFARRIGADLTRS